MFHGQFDRERPGLLKQVVPGTIHGLYYLFLGAVMRYGDSHSRSLTSGSRKYIACRTNTVANVYMPFVVLRASNWALWEPLHSVSCQPFRRNAVSNYSPSSQMHKSNA